MIKEDRYLQIINRTLTDSSLLGDDCAFLKAESLGNSGLYITQDSLVEDVHFSLSTTTPYKLGYKAIQVNLSDLAAMCASPLFVTISLSLPADIDGSFVENFYKGVNVACLEAGTKVVGGDLTGSEKVFISVTAIGKKTAKCDISRANAKAGDVVLVTGNHGDSAAGLKLLQENKYVPLKLLNAHIEPKAQLEKSQILAQLATKNFAMMDTSDGLADGLYKISKAGNVSIEVDFDKIPISREIVDNFPDDYKDLVLWGGEDYQLLCCVDKELGQKLEDKGFYLIGEVKEAVGLPKVTIKNTEKIVIDDSVFSKKSFNHFGE